jgi:small subunit ribosomal protein S16
MVRLRLRRIGLKGQPTYRIVAADKESPRDGKEDRAYHWMQNGALPTESVAQIFKSAGLMERFERFKKGEVVETLLKEAEEAETKRGATVKTGK